ncbi:hypothetical protein BKD30_07345 [Tersicoccus phoenicis]|uniref:Metallo-beta-lactamase domain-containing protein n=1 Tax=Tersicoccus phoenicis TaxID=554083 RepID=A0A1R1LBE6_9MICC|nr:MBL fold metallo-hydrolase [Tersicoccus phoenicis]OMH24816.1 hypothetical protein BKD30_07345 [Tersicoccus phoenicis]
MTAIHAVVMEIAIPAGALGPDPVTVDVRAHLVPHATGLLLVDTGMDADGAALDATLDEISATWSDVSHVVITHGHPDHVGGLDHVRAVAPHARVLAHPEERVPDAEPLADQQVVGPLRAIATPGHTAEHLSFLHEDANTLFVGDCLGTVGGRVNRAPRPFTADVDQAERTLHDLLRFRDARMIFAHGPEVADPWDQLDRLLAA